MDEDISPIKPLKGAWDSIGTDTTEQIKFEININQRVKFADDFKLPEERKSNSDNPNEVYYVFNVLQEGTEKHFNASAWSLLRELKKNEPLAGKMFDIIKKLVKGKQQYFVTEVILENVK